MLGVCDGSASQILMESGAFPSADGARVVGAEML